MDNTYEAWVMMNKDNDVITDEYNTPFGAVCEMEKRGYDRDEMIAAGFTLNKLLCSKNCWLECLEEIEY